MSDVEDLQGALKARGWVRIGGHEGVFEVWGAPVGPQEVIVPLDPARGDFEHLLDRARRHVAEMSRA